MTTELEVLGLVSDRLSAHGLPFMLTGSFALAYYATPRMTRDLDIVVALQESDVDSLVAAFESDFYVDADAARTAILSERMFNLMHLESGVKVDLIVRKSSEFRQVEFARRKPVAIAGIQSWIVSCEDLILSKLDAMSDTSDAISKLVSERYRAMTPAERLFAASSLFETARAIIQSSLPSDLTTEEQRLAVARRLYNNELPEVALIAHARHVSAST